jgi:hypothetical protein
LAHRKKVDFSKKISDPRKKFHFRKNRILPFFSPSFRENKNFRNFRKFFELFAVAKNFFEKWPKIGFFCPCFAFQKLRKYRKSKIYKANFAESPRANSQSCSKSRAELEKHSFRPQLQLLAELRAKWKFWKFSKIFFFEKFFSRPKRSKKMSFQEWHYFFI